jgi:hypothetical protein
VIELAQYRRQREEQDLEQATAMRLAGARTERRRVEIIGEAETRRHQLRLRQIADEHRAEENALKQREIEIRGSSADSPLARLQQADALKEVLHGREVLRQETELAVARAKDAEEVRLAEAARARKQQQLADVEEGIAAFEQLYGQASQFASFAIERSAEQQEAELDRTVAALNGKGRAQQAAIAKEIKAADGNVALQNEIRRKGARQEAELQARIEKANEDHQERQRRTAARGAGWKLMIDAVVNGAKAISAFASFNYVQGALYVAAAAFNAAQGGMLLSGNVPGGGGGGGGGSEALSAGGGASDRETSAASSTPGSTPGEAARRSTSPDRGGPSQGGTSVVVNGGIHVLGGADDDTIEKLAKQLKNLDKSREP